MPQNKRKANAIGRESPGATREVIESTGPCGIGGSGLKLRHRGTSLGAKPLATFGDVHPRVLAAFDLKGAVSAFEVFLDAIPEARAKSKARPVFTPSPYQAIERDFAFLVDQRVSADEVLRAAKGADRNLIETATIFDLYEGKGVPDDKKSLAIAVRIQAKDKTLTEPEIEALVQKIVNAVTKATGAVLRA